MPHAVKYNATGNEIGEIELADDIFNQKINEPIVHKVVTAQLATKRRGTASTKTRSEVSGGGRRPWRQKGTGRARHGSIRSPLWVGGGITFGPKPKSHNQKASKKEKRLAMRSILSDKFNGNNIKIVDEIKFSEIKTKQMIDLLKQLDLNDKKVLVLLPEPDKNIYLSSRNLQNVKTLVLDALNAYALLNNDYIVIPEKALRKVEEVLGK